MAHKDQVTKPSVSFNISRFESQMEMSMSQSIPPTVSPWKGWVGTGPIRMEPISGSLILGVWDYECYPAAIQHDGKSQFWIDKIIYRPSIALLNYERVYGWLVIGGFIYPLPLIPSDVWIQSQPLAGNTQRWRRPRCSLPSLAEISWRLGQVQGSSMEANCGGKIIHITWDIKY